MPGDHDVDIAGSNVGDQALVLRPLTAAIGAAVVVFVGADDSPAPGLAERFAVGTLALDASAFALPVKGDPCVDGGPHSDPIL